MAVMCQFAMDVATREDLRSALATYLTACSRGAQAPALALGLARGETLPSQLEDRLVSLEEALQAAAPDPSALSQVIGRAWSSLGILAGNRPWERALPAFGPVLRHASRGRELNDVALSVIARQVREMRSAALLESSRMRLPPTKLMNFHQTKGREADAVILVYRDGDVLSSWSDSEPYEESSRVLYVSLTRARQRLSVILPTDPHPLVAPFGQLAS